MLQPRDHDAGPSTFRVGTRRLQLANPVVVRLLLDRNNRAGPSCTPSTAKAPGCRPGTDRVTAGVFCGHYGSAEREGTRESTGDAGRAGDGDPPTGCNCGSCIDGRDRGCSTSYFFTGRWWDSAADGSACSNGSSIRPSKFRDSSSGDGEAGEAPNSTAGEVRMSSPHPT